MAWPHSKEVTWGHGTQPTVFADQPVAADTLILEGCPVGSASGFARPCQAGDAFLGFAERTADNTLATAAAPNILSRPNFGDGTTGSGGASVRLRIGGRVRLYKSLTPDNTGTIGNAPQGLAGTQADIDSKLYYNGSGFTTTSGGNTLVGRVVEVGSSLFGTVFWDIELPAQVAKA